jgi:LmbE family N-acetylglucosaminyl deacetylase
MTIHTLDHTGLDRWDDLLSAALPWIPTADPLVMVVPHPDDEALSVGGLIAHQRAMGSPVSIVAVTDGDAAHTPAGDPGLAALRRGEQDRALTVLGVAEEDRIRLGLPDGRVAEHERSLSDHLAVLCSRDTVIVAPSRFDVHPDHEAVGRAAVVAAQRIGCRLSSYLFWAWHQADPAAFASREFLSLELSPTVQRRKWHALAQHTTQLECWDGHGPVLPPDLIVPATWSHEYFVIEAP